MPISVRTTNVLIALPHIGVGVLVYSAPPVLAAVGIQGLSPALMPWEVVLGTGLMLAQGVVIASASTSASGQRVRTFVTGFVVALGWTIWAGIELARVGRGLPHPVAFVPLALSEVASCGVPALIAVICALSVQRWSLLVTAIGLLAVLAGAVGSAGWIRGHELLWGVPWVFEPRSLLFALYQLTALPVVTALVLETYGPPVE